MKTSEKTTDTATKTDSSVSTTETDIVEPFPPTIEQLAEMDFSKKNYVIATDQRETDEQMGAVVLFDMEKAFENRDLDSAVVWRYQRERSLNCFRCPSGVKYRTNNAVYGDVVLIACSGGYAGVISFPEGKELWHVDSCGNNPHSIEILPDGAVVTASSNGNEVRIYAPKSAVYTSVNVPDAHAVLWDDANKCLWALEGFGVLHAYEEVVSDGKYSLKEIKSYKTRGGAHECTQDFSDPDYLFIAVTDGIVRINKHTGEFSMMHSVYDVPLCKGYGINRLGNYIYTTSKTAKKTVWENDSYASWCTPFIYFAYGKRPQTIRCESKECAFYKSYAFCGDY